jgi:flagellar biosynthesis protein FlhF
MYLRRFRGANVRDALRSVREALGPDALVLSQQMVSARGWRGLVGVREVEITAAAERQAPLAAPQASVGRPQESENRQRRGSVDTVAAQLAATGLDRTLAEEIAALLPPRARRSPTTAILKSALASRLETIAAPDTVYAPVEVFIGPPGAGKTTTVAKIAAQERARRGTRLGLVAADGFRVGAIQQLRSYADILDAPFGVAKTHDDLARALTMTHKMPVLVDTAGRSASDPSARELCRLIGQVRTARTHLVLPAGISTDAARRLFDAYADAKPSRLVLTRLDEVDSLSPLVSLLCDRRIPVSYLGTGQRVPEDLNRATADLLAASVLGDLAPCEAHS